MAWGSIDTILVGEQRQTLLTNVPLRNVFDATIFLYYSKMNTKVKPVALSKAGVVAIKEWF